MLKLQQEISSIFDFFDLEEEAKLEKFQETLESAIKFSEKIKDRIANGTEEERKELQAFLNEMQEKIENEKNKVFEKIGVSEEDLQTFLNDQNNFTEEEWNSMQSMKDYLKQTIIPSEEKPKIKRKKSKTKWIQS
ncbi:MAG: hypothetical protein K1060chlam1_00341 [Candidatus Anoxychlamydiales bacterium]|nr:hypothetical protein [Candidatus Anoxychlamydiales bacterium]